VSNYALAAQGPMPSYDSMYADFTTPARMSLEDRRGFLLSYIPDVERDLRMAEQRLRMARHELDVTSKALENLAAGFDAPQAEGPRMGTLRTADGWAGDAGVKTNHTHSKY